ncbi:MAG: hypothetical protein ACE5HT_14425 [Gemmatimonadales bacterium]
MAFLLPFMAVALGTAIMAMLRLVAGDPAQAGFFALFALTFGGVSGFFLLTGRAGVRRKVQKERLQEQHPMEPWTWRADWASGRIESNLRKRLAFAWFFAGLWNLISAVTPFVALKALHDGNKAGLVALVFPAIGVGLLVWAVRETLRYRKFGVSVLELTSVPGVIGRGIDGVIQANFELDPGELITTKLVCVRRVTTGSGKNRSTSERILWQEEGAATEAHRELRRTAIPVSFGIPADAVQSDDSDPDDQVVWRLEAAAKIPGVDYFARFEVPVFKLAHEPDSGQAVVGPEPPVLPDSAYRPPDGSGIEVTTGERGTEIYFSAARNAGAALGTTMFFLIWTGATIFLYLKGAPLLFAAVFGIFDLLLLFVAAGLWTGVTRVVIGGGTIDIWTGFLVPVRRQVLMRAAIAEVSVDIGMQSGNRPYYRITIVGTDGAKVIVGRGIRDKRHAEWLASLMR